MLCAQFHTTKQFPKIRGTLLGLPTIWAVVFWGLYMGVALIIYGNDHVYQCICKRETAPERRADRLGPCQTIPILSQGRKRP